MQSFTLSMGGSVNTGIENVRWRKVLEILRSMQAPKAEYNYLILSASDTQPIDGCSYIRVAYNNKIYRIEATFDFTKYLYSTRNIYETENILEDFYIKEKAPRTEKWGWQEKIIL